MGTVVFDSFFRRSEICPSPDHLNQWLVVTQSVTIIMQPASLTVRDWKWYAQSMLKIPRWDLQSIVGYQWKSSPHTESLHVLWWNIWWHIGIYAVSLVVIMLCLLFGASELTVLVDPTSWISQRLLCKKMWSENWRSFYPVELSLKRSG